jgi:hypothetical protein
MVLDVPAPRLAFTSRFQMTAMKHECSVASQIARWRI